MPVPSIPAAIELVVKASLILGVTALAAASLRRASASARHFVWMLGLSSALVLPALSLVTPRWEVPVLERTEGTEGTGQHHNGGTKERRIPGQLNSTDQLDSKDQRVSVSPFLRVKPVPFSPSAPSPQPPFPPSPAAIAAAVWAIGALIVLARMLLGLLAVQWISRRTVVVSDAPWLDEARTVAGALRLRRVRFVRSETQSMPMAWGVFRRSVLMPADADGWPDERLRIVLLHELAHVKRHDCLTHLVAQVACAAYWFNPLAWIAARRLRIERERACDDLVLASGTRGSDYADQLVDIARVIGAGRFPAVLAGATVAMARRSQLEGRLMAILDPSLPRRSLTRVGAAAAIALFAVLIVPVAAVQPWTAEPAAVKGTQQPVERTVVQDDTQGRVQGAIQDGVAGGISGGIEHGVVRGVEHGVTEGVRSGVRRDIEGAIDTGVRAGVAAGVGTGVGVGVGEGIGTGVDVATGVAQTIATEIANRVANSITARAAEHQRHTDPRAVDALVAALNDPDKDVREAAVQVLADLRDPHAFEPLVAALKDRSADVRRQAAVGLGQLRDARAVEPLAAAATDTNVDVREQVVVALGEIGDPRAIDALTTALKDATASVRQQAAFALGQIR